MTDISVNDFVFSVGLSNEHPVVGDDIYLSIRVKSTPYVSGSNTMTFIMVYYLDDPNNVIYGTWISATYVDGKFESFDTVVNRLSGAAVPVLPDYIGKVIGCKLEIYFNGDPTAFELVTSAVLDNSSYTPEQVEIITAEYDFSTLPLRIATTAPIVGGDFVVATPPLQLANDYIPEDAAVEIILDTDILGMPTGKCSTVLMQNQAVKVITPVKVLPAARGQLISPHAIINKYPNMGKPLYRADFDTTTVPVDEPDSLKSIAHICTGVTNEYSNAVAYLSTDQPIVGEKLTVTTIPFINGTGSHTVIWIFYDVSLDDGAGFGSGGARKIEPVDIDKSNIDSYPQLISDSFDIDIPELWLDKTVTVDVSYTINGVDVICPSLTTKPVLLELPPEPDESDSSSSSSEILPEPPAPKTRCQLLNDAIIQQVSLNQ